ncbi:MAG TPA: TIR domain-containing protein [Thermoanaerobaculia bacterium]|jgi:tetratricopeptide (TPR) repeat protein
MSASPFDVFVSYTNADSQWVRKTLIPRLQHEKFVVCDYDVNFKPGADVIEAITESMSNSRCTLLVVTRSYLNSAWTRYESRIAEHSRITRGTGVIPLLLEKCDAGPIISSRLFIDFTDSAAHEVQFRRLFAALRSDSRSALLSPSPLPTPRGGEPAPPLYRNFDIELTTSDGDRYRLRARCQDIGETEQAVAVPYTELQLGVEAVRRGDGGRQTWENVGRKLYRTVFTSEVAKLWDEAAAVSNADGHHILRLRLRVVEPRLAALPWELLQKESFSLAMMQPIARHNAEIRMPALDAQCGAKILFADTAARISSRTTPAVRRHLESLKTAGQLERLRVLDHASFEDLKLALGEGIYDVLHAVVETTLQDGGSRLILHDENGRPIAMEGERFALIVRQSPVRLLVLSAADSNLGAGPEGALAEAAIGANRSGVPAVVAVQGKVGHRGTIAFAAAFYDALATGCPVEAGMTAGRNAIVRVEGIDNAKWALPMLFNDEPDAIVFGSQRRRDCFEIEKAAADPPYGHTPRMAHNIGDDFRQELIGRDAALRQISDALAAPGATNVVVVKSAPGFGKTAVAARFAWEAAHPPPSGRRYDSVTWISPATAKTTDPGEVLRGSVHQITSDALSYALLKTHGAAAESAGETPLLKIELPARLREIASLLGIGRHLVVIDDVSPAAEESVRTFIKAMPRNVDFVVTSMRRLGIGEQEVELGPLPERDLRALMWRVADGATPGALPAAGNPFVAVVEMRRLLDGKPRLPMPTGDTAVAEYTRALIPDLTPQERGILAVCIQLPFAADRFILGRASKLDDDEFAVAERGLLRLGLIETRGTSLLLCGTLRALFRDGEEEAMRMSLDAKRPAIEALMEFLDLLQRQFGAPDSPQFVRKIAGELGNMVWGVRTAWELRMFEHQQGFRNFLQDALYSLGFWETALQTGEIAYLAASRIGGYDEMGWAALYPMTRIHYQRQELRNAERWCATALSLFENTGNPTGIVSAKRYLGRIRQSEGDFVAARMLFTEILDEVRRRSSRRDEVSMSIENLAALELAAGRLDVAERLYHEALAEQEPGPKTISALTELGRLALRRDVDEALRYFFRARSAIAHAEWDSRFAKIAHSIGLAYEQKGDYLAARDQFRTAHDIFIRLDARAERDEAAAALVRVITLYERAVPE